MTSAFPAPARFSPSQAAKFNDCPRSWRHRYIDRLPDPSGLPAEIGTYAHAILEHLFAVDLRDPDMARIIARELWAEYLPKLLAVDPYRGHAELKRMVWAAVEGLWQLEDPEQVEVAATERRIEVELQQVPMVLIVDRVDTTPAGLQIVDYKTGKAGKFALAKAHKQVQLYAAAVELVDQAPVVAGRLIYTTAKEVHQVDTAPHAQAVAVDDLACTWEQVNTACTTGEFRAKPGGLCARFCPFLAHCPEGQAHVAAQGPR